MSVFIAVAALEVVECARLVALLGNVTLLAAVTAATGPSIGVVGTVLGEVAHWNICQYVLGKMAKHD